MCASSEATQPISETAAGCHGNNMLLWKQHDQSTARQRQHNGPLNNKAERKTSDFFNLHGNNIALQNGLFENLAHGFHLQVNNTFSLQIHVFILLLQLLECVNC
jgi:hypothetical protein